VAERLRDDLETGAAGEGWSRPAIAKELGREAGRCLTDLIPGQEFRGVRRIPCTLVIRESCGARSRAAGNPTGGI
jgi:hypothetical protein